MRGEEDRPSLVGVAGCDVVDVTVEDMKKAPIVLEEQTC